MKKSDELIYIANHQRNYFQTVGKTLDQRLEQIILDQQEVKDIVIKQGVKTLRDKGLGLLGRIGDIISTCLDWNEEVNNQIAEAKKYYLLEQYFNKVDNVEQAIYALSDFLKNPQGNTLFNKILRILDDSPPDKELSQHLSNALKKIIEQGNFEELFEKHRFSLNQIEKLTPQALTIISDYKSWPTFKLSTIFSNGPKVTSEYYSEFTMAYGFHHGITDSTKLNRIKHSVIELHNSGIIEAYKIGPSNMVRCELTEIGKDLLVYLE